MIRGGKMWDQTYGCANQYRCCIDYYLMSFLSKLYKFVLDRALDTPFRGKYVVDVFNDFQKRYLATYLRMLSMPEVDNIYSKCMRDDAMTEKGEVSFAEECKRLLDLCGEIGAKVDKKHAKCKSKSRLKHK